MSPGSRTSAASSTRTRGRAPAWSPPTAAAGVVVVDLDRRISGAERDAAIDAAGTRLRQLPREIPGASVQIGGDPLLNREINEQVQADTERPRWCRCRSRWS